MIGIGHKYQDWSAVAVIRDRLSAGSWSGRAAINGEVIDASGAIVPGAKVVVDAPSIGRTIETTSNDSGFFTTAGLVPGDLSAFAVKDIRIFDHLKTQFRIESFNAANHVNVSEINTQLGDRAFGQITGVGAPRYFQSGIKLIW